MSHKTNPQANAAQDQVQQQSQQAPQTTQSTAGIDFDSDAPIEGGFCDPNDKTCESCQ